MLKDLKEIFDWSEVWATLIPLFIFLWRKPKEGWLRPLVTYLLLALLLSLIIDFTWKSKELGLQDWSERVFSWLYLEAAGKKRLFNVIFYNINSFVRLFFITWFFYKVNPAYKKIYIAITILFLIGVIINFTAFENIRRSFSSRLMTVESAVMLFYCLLYFYAVNMNDEIESPSGLPHFLVVVGLTLYTAVNFLIFLFFNYLISAEVKYAKDVWNVHNAMYIVLMLFIAFAFKKAK